MKSLYSVGLLFFLCAVIFIRLPNIYLIPFVREGIFTSQALSRIILIGLFITIYIPFFRKKNLPMFKSRYINILLLLFFLSSSLSIMYAQNMEAFLSRYKDLIIGVISFFVFHAYSHEKKKITIALLLPIPINILYQLLLLNGGYTVSYLKSIIYEKHFDLVSYNLQRGRIYTDVYDEATISLITLFLKAKKKSYSVSAIVCLIFICALAFISNFRTRILMFAIGIVSSFSIIQKMNIKRFFQYILIFIVISIFVSSLSSLKWGYTFYDRFLFKNFVDIKTIFSRYDQIDNAISIGFMSPFGVGLGNYTDEIISERSVFYAYVQDNTVSTAYQYIHNNFAMIIAESGYITLLFYILLLIEFIKIDYLQLKQDDKYHNAFIISFWLLFFFGLFNPPIPGSYQILFWGIRGLIT